VTVTLFKRRRAIMPANTNLIYRVVYSPTSFAYAVVYGPDDVDWFHSAKAARRTGRNEIVVVSDEQFKTMMEA
jgi:hypothetical protein